MSLRGGSSSFLPEVWPTDDRLNIFHSCCSKTLTTTVQDIEHLQSREIHSIGSHTSNEATLELARSWLTQCRQQHLSCELLAAKKEFLPARLIDIGPTSSSEWRLWVQARDQYRPEKYLTLSHRWGTTSFLNLNKSNIEILEAGLPISALPKTFKEAVEIVRRLGGQFLWIDSLCILQDCLKDWQEQSAAMRDIYTDTLCNIAATGALDSHGGCFFERNVSDVLPCRIPPHPQGFPREDCTVVSMDTWTDDIEQAPLNQRGWVLQERLLAARTVHFGAQQIFWECNEMNACEIYPKKLPSTHFLHRRGSIRCNHPLFSANSASSARDSGQQLSVAQDLYTFWSRIVGSYSRCSLTESADKLAALSGLASQLQQITKDDYYAGLWGKDLAGQLLWHVIGCAQADGSDSKRASSYRAPTWSWASIDGLVKTHDVPFDIDSFSKPLFDVVDIQTVPLANDITGQIARAHLILRGVLTKASIIIGPGDATKLSIGKLERRILFQLDTRLVESLPDLSCLPIGHCVWPDYIGGPSVEGLILQRTPAEDHLYTRLGTFKVESCTQCEELGLEFSSENSLGNYPCHVIQQLIIIH
jgi:Heterokaryon incompatibility protein (HET)